MRPRKKKLTLPQRPMPSIKVQLSGVTIVVGPNRSLWMTRKEYADLQLVMGAMP